MTKRALVLSAASSGAGKTVTTLAILRALKRRGVQVTAAKSGPDYIDPAFHAQACGAASVNLDAWAMGPKALRGTAANRPGDLLLVEGAMGVLDGAVPDGKGSTADLAEILGLPVILILDIAKSAQSAALSYAGLCRLRPELTVAGVILNRAGSDRHGQMARSALEAAGAQVFGSLPRSAALELAERHLGLVQAAELPGLQAFLDAAADLIEARLDLDALMAASQPLAPAPPSPCLPPLGQRIAIARDLAFSFAYPHLLEGWQAQGAEVLPFSPLADEAPDPKADAVFLPGGYPELHAGKLAGNATFLNGLRASADDALIYGECGGYMVLGDALTDAGGITHPMAGLLPVRTSFAKRKLHLGYRRLTHNGPLPWGSALMAHEFHYASTLSRDGNPLFAAQDAAGVDLGSMGITQARVCGSFAHVISAG